VETNDEAAPATAQYTPPVIETRETVQALLQLVRPSDTGLCP
jgi:hypothetical protein